MGLIKRMMQWVKKPFVKKEAPLKYSPYEPPPEPSHGTPKKLSIHERKQRRHEEKQMAKRRRCRKIAKQSKRRNRC